MQRRGVRQPCFDHEDDDGADVVDSDDGVSGDDDEDYDYGGDRDEVEYSDNGDEVEYSDNDGGNDEIGSSAVALSLKRFHSFVVVGATIALLQPLRKQGATHYSFISAHIAFKGAWGNWATTTEYADCIIDSNAISAT